MEASETAPTNEDRQANRCQFCGRWMWCQSLGDFNGVLMGEFIGIYGLIYKVHT